MQSQPSEREFCFARGNVAPYRTGFSTQRITHLCVLFLLFAFWLIVCPTDPAGNKIGTGDVQLVSSLADSPDFHGCAAPAVSSHPATHCAILVTGLFYPPVSPQGWPAQPRPVLRHQLLLTTSVAGRGPPAFPA